MSDFLNYPGLTTLQIAEFTLYEAAFPKPENKLTDIAEARRLASEYGCYCLYRLPPEDGDDPDCVAVPQSFINTVTPFYEWVIVDVGAFRDEPAFVCLTFGNGGPWDDEPRLELRFTTGDAPWETT